MVLCALRFCFLLVLRDFSHNKSVLSQEARKESRRMSQTQLSWQLTMRCLTRLRRTNLNILLK